MIKIESEKQTPSINVTWQRILDYNNLDQKPFVGWINYWNGTMERITAFFIHGGLKYPKPGLSVGLERVGQFLFSTNEFYSAQYCHEKLFVSLGDAGAIADWINTQLRTVHKEPMQGNYNPRYRDIGEDSYYGLSGENKLLVLQPCEVWAGYSGWRKENYCPYCAKCNDGAIDVTDASATPSCGDFSVCISCLEVAMFNPDLILVKTDISHLERDELAHIEKIRKTLLEARDKK